jgi:hypothetical protein
MDAGDPNTGLPPVVCVKFKEPAGANRLFELGDLITLREIGIEVILSCERGAVRNATAQGKAEAEDEFNQIPVQDRQGPGHPEAYGAHVAVGLVPERGGAAAKRF